MIILDNVSKVFPNRVTALHDINLRVDKGEFVFVVGPSGAGKSTLTKLLYREITPTRGVVMVDGRNLQRLRGTQVALLRRSIGVVFQDFRLLPDKTVFENVAFALEVIEATPREIRRKVPGVLALVGLRQKANAYPTQLSGGEQQRVALARAMVNNPALLICDEPTGNLDPQTAWEIMRLLSEINALGTTVIVATHAKPIVNAMRRRVVAVDQGKILRDEERGSYDFEV
ncbi:MAG: cell division ATP-binding protein FtsE [Bacillota bacterium]